MGRPGIGWFVGKSVSILPDLMGLGIHLDSR